MRRKGSAKTASYPGGFSTKRMNWEIVQMRWES